MLLWFFWIILKVRLLLFENQNVFFFQHATSLLSSVSAFSPVILSLFIFCYRQEKSSAGLSHILAAFIIFLKTLAVNFRIRVCELGDEILPTLLYIWTQHRLNDSLKEVIIELFQLQIYIHHPKGAKTQEKGIKKVFAILHLLLHWNIEG